MRRSGRRTHSGRDKVVLGKGTYEIEIPIRDGDANESGDLFPDGPTVIRGWGPHDTKIDGNGIDRVLFFASTATGSLESLTVKGGAAGAASSAPGKGGGIINFSSGEFTLKNVVVKGNEADLGGGILSNGRKLTIRDSTISGNDAIEGGGIRLESSNFFTPATTIRASTIAGNSASNKGGGILVDGLPFSDPPVVDIQNSTIAENQAGGDTGGILADNDATVALDNATVAHNMADSDNAGGGNAGGVLQNAGAAFALVDSVVAANSVGSSGGTGTQCAGAFGDSSGALIQTQTGLCTFVGSFSVSADAMLGPLQDNGGPTKTVALLSGSPAIGLATTCPKFDQRGKPRPEEDCDSSAFERKGP